MTDAANSTMLHLHFGALADPLYQQVIQQGFSIPSSFEDDCLEFQNLQGDADAITRLKVRGYVTDAAAKRMRLAILEKAKGLILGAMLIVLLAAPLSAQRQCPDCKDGFGCGDPRVPYTVCTPWPKPSFEEWQRGWRWAPPATLIPQVPTALVRAWDGRVLLSSCSLAPDEPARGMPRCSTVRPEVPGPAIRLDSWCAFLRALPMPPPSGNPNAIQGGRPTFTGVCGT